MRTKALFESKTASFNFIVAIFAALAFFWPPAAEFANTHGPSILLAIGLINIGLRRVTKGSWTLFPILIGFLALSLPSCVNSYQVDGAGRDWIANPVQVLPANRVTPLADVPLPSSIGGGFVTVPIVITPEK